MPRGGVIFKYEQYSILGASALQASLLLAYTLPNLAYRPPRHGAYTLPWRWATSYALASLAYVYSLATAPAPATPAQGVYTALATVTLGVGVVTVWINERKKYVCSK